MDALVSRWALPPSTFVDVKGLKVHLRDEGPRGDTAPLVLIHGTSSSLQTWEGWVAALKGHRRVITFDLPGFGLTGPNAQGDYHIESYVRFVLDLLDMLHVEHCVAGGNSLGGDIAWQLAVKAPKRIERLILIDAAGYPMPSQSESICFYMAKTPVLNRLLRFVMSRSFIESGLKKLYGNPSLVTQEVVDRHVQLMLRHGNRGALIRTIQQSKIGAVAAHIKDVKQPTLIIWGGLDRLIPREHAERFHGDISGSRLEIFEDLGHMPQEEAPVRTVAAVLEFLKIAKTDVFPDKKKKKKSGWLEKWKSVKCAPAKIAAWITGGPDVDGQTRQDLHDVQNF